MDAVICPAAFETLGGVEEARDVAREIHRVVKPGGVAGITVGFRIEGTAAPKGPVLFDEAALRSVFLADELSWAISDPLDPRPADSKLASRDGETVWTSAHLLLVKPLYH